MGRYCLNVPPDLQHLIEKREVPDRRVRERREPPPARPPSVRSERRTNRDRRSNRGRRK